MGRPPFEFPPGTRVGLLDPNAPEYISIDCPSGLVIKDLVPQLDAEGNPVVDSESGKAIVNLQVQLIGGMHFASLPRADGKTRVIVCERCRGWGKVLVHRDTALRILDLTDIHKFLAANQPLAS